MMCDFDVGDQIQRVAGNGDATGSAPQGWVGRCTSIHPDCDPDWPGTVGITVDTWPLPAGRFHCADYWKRIDPLPDAEMTRVREMEDA